MAKLIDLVGDDLRDLRGGLELLLGAEPPDVGGRGPVLDLLVDQRGQFVQDVPQAVGNPSAAHRRNQLGQQSLPDHESP